MKKLVSILVLLALCVTVFAACGENKQDDTSLTEAGEYLFGLYKDEATVTPSDYDVVGKVMVGDVAFTVEWTVDVAEGVTIKESSKAGFITIDVNEKTPNEIAYVLTATIKSESGATVQKTFNRTIPAYNVFSYAQYAAAEDDSALVVEGIVIGIFSKSNGSSSNGLYLQDANNEGGYYVYNLTDDPSADLGIKIGMTVNVTGVKDTYNGLYEIVNATVAITDETIKEVAPVDYTEAYTKAAALNEAALVERQSMLVTVKGVEITGQETESGYYKFKLADKEAYVRISSSNNCISKEDIESFKKIHTDNFGYTADVTGIVQLYSGNFYLIPVTADAFANCALPERSDAEKLAMELETVTVDGVFTESKTVDLPVAGTTYPEVKYAWTSDNAGIVIGADGKMTITVPEAPATATVTLTATCGAATETKTFSVSLTKLATPADVVNAAYALAEGAALPGSYTLSGPIVSIDTAYSEQYKNITVTILVEGKNIQCYRLAGEGAEKLAVGDNITVTGVIKNYKGTVEFDAKCTLDSAKSVKEIVDAAFALAEGAAMDGTYTLTGAIASVDTAYSEQYKNVTVTITVEGKNIQCYRLKGEGADTIKVGDTITVTGKIKNYKGTVEFDSGCVLGAVVKGA